MRVGSWSPLRRGAQESSGTRTVRRLGLGKTKWAVTAGNGGDSSSGESAAELKAVSVCAVVRAWRTSCSQIKKHVLVESEVLLGPAKHMDFTEELHKSIEVIVGLRISEILCIFFCLSVLKCPPLTSASQQSSYFIRKKNIIRIVNNLFQ